jgi:hypothetical protein
VKLLQRLYIAIFDGTNRLGEALNVLARFVDENFDIIPLLKACHVAAKGLLPGVTLVLASSRLACLRIRAYYTLHAVRMTGCSVMAGSFT